MVKCLEIEIKLGFQQIPLPHLTRENKRQLSKPILLPLKILISYLRSYTGQLYSNNKQLHTLKSFLEEAILNQSVLPKDPSNVFVAREKKKSGCYSKLLANTCSILNALTNTARMTSMTEEEALHSTLRAQYANKSLSDVYFSLYLFFKQLLSFSEQTKVEHIKYKTYSNRKRQLSFLCCKIIIN